MSADNTAAVPSVKLPKAVQMQVEQANIRMKEQSDRLKEEVEARFKEETPTGTQTLSQPQTEPETTPEPVVAPVVTTPEVKSKEEDPKYWEHRFKTSQGMFEAEKTRLKSEIDNLRTKQGGFETRFRELEDKLRAAERQAPKEIDLKKYLTEEQIDTYGPEVLKSVAKIASNAAEETLERRLKEEIDRHVRPVQEELNTVKSGRDEERESRFWDNIDAKIPDWVIINDKPEFRQWLDQRDPFSGFRRQDLLTQAQKVFDSERIVAMFEAFKQSSPAPKTPDVVSTQHRVVPDPVGQTVVVTANIPEDAFVTRAQISRFYDDCKLGRYRNRPQEKDAMEKKIREAVTLGRVR